MDRALRNVNDVAAATSDRRSGYPDLNNLQLAQEVQKLNGYNHFSSSTANLLEEVVRRLVNSQETEVKFSNGCRATSSSDPLDQPVTFGSMVTLRDIKEAPFSVTMDPCKHLKKSQIPVLVKQLVNQGFKEDVAEGYLEALKKSYNINAIAKQSPANVDLVFYWLKNGSLYWNWTTTKDTEGFTYLPRNLPGPILS